MIKLFKLIDDTKYKQLKMMFLYFLASMSIFH